MTTSLLHNSHVFSSLHDLT